MDQYWTGVPSQAAPVKKRPFPRLLLVLGIVATVAAIAGLALAQTSTTEPGESATDTVPAPVPGGPKILHGGPGFEGPHGFGLGGIHGEFVTRAPGGGYQTIASQVGEVTAVDQSSITLRSEDGYSRTYAVEEDTLVNAGRDGIGSVETGDTAHVTAIVNGETATAMHIVNMSDVQRAHERWMPAPPGVQHNSTRSSVSSQSVDA